MAEFVVKDKRLVDKPDAVNTYSGEPASLAVEVSDQSHGVLRSDSDPRLDAGRSPVGVTASAERETGRAGREVVPNRAEVRKMMKQRGILNDPRWHGFKPRSPKAAPRNWSQMPRLSKLRKVFGPYPDGMLYQLYATEVAKANG